jgi:hypothetical protein
MGIFTIDQPTLNKIKNNESESLRQKAYKDEADPLFFMYQRGEISMQEWLDKIKEIKQRFPKYLPGDVKE